jgi:hypothetical protein
MLALAFLPFHVPFWSLCGYEYDTVIETANQRLEDAVNEPAYQRLEDRTSV